MWNPFNRNRPAPGPPPAASAPRFSPENARYEGRPLLMLLENYILAAIGELPPDWSVGVGRIVQKMWGGDEDWMRTLRQELGLEHAIDDELRRLWTRNQEIARENRMDLHPVEFARMVADENFASLLHPPR